MDDYKITEAHAHEFKHQCALRRTNKFRFKFEHKDIETFADLLFTVYELVNRNHTLEKVYSDKALDFFRIINEQVVFFETNSYVMQNIYYKAFKKFIATIRDYGSKYHVYGYGYGYGHIQFNKNSEIITLLDLSHFTIDLSKISKIKCNWENFPESLSRYTLQIKKSIYKSLKEGMLDQFDYFYSESNQFFGKWEKRGIVFMASEYRNYPFSKVNTAEIISQILYVRSSGNNCNTTRVINALDNALDKIYLEDRETLIRISPINLWFALENVGEGDSMQYMEEAITESLLGAHS